MEPPRRPRDSDLAKRKAELEESHRAAPSTPAITADELAECDKVCGGTQHVRGHTWLRAVAADDDQAGL